ncbi:MAG: glycoside hydrolase family 16 protein [Victivallaceae bacterium]
MWNLVWSEEFDYNGLPDERFWSYESGVVRNKEPQHYMVRSLENTFVGGSVLTIQALKKRIANNAYQVQSDDWRYRKFSEYSSGSINTLGKQSFLYGRLEVRAQIPTGNGAWPAIWMMGANRPQLGWPACGEIDIMENWGQISWTKPENIHATCHYPNFKKDSIEKYHSKGGYFTANRPWDDFHTYAMEWDENKLEFFYDDISYFSFNIDEAGPGSENPFRQPQYLLLNLALTQEPDNSIFPLQFKVDFVRYYHKNNS